MHHPHSLTWEMSAEAAWERDIVVCSRIRRLRKHGYVRTISWYLTRSHLPDVVDVRSS